jgi:hypothetical protein
MANSSEVHMSNAETSELAGNGGDTENRQARHRIHFTVDCEPVEVLSRNPEETELTVREILDDSGNTPASDFWLVEFMGEGHKERREYRNLDERIKVRNHARFAAICERPTPVS